MMQQINQQKRKVLVAITGSVASLKALELVKSLLCIFQIKLILTQKSKKFVPQRDIQQLRQLKVECLSDEDQQMLWAKRGDPVLHIELRRWADALIIAPLSANTLAKISNGVCDNLVTLICRCWDMKLRKEKQQDKPRPIKNKLITPIVIAPAMNTLMWQHPVTEQQLTRLTRWGYTVVNPVEKILICGDQGKGAMASIQSITATLLSELQYSQIQ